MADENRNTENAAAAQDIFGKTAISRKNQKMGYKISPAPLLTHPASGPW